MQKLILAVGDEHQQLTSFLKPSDLEAQGRIHSAASSLIVRRTRSSATELFKLPLTRQNIQRSLASTMTVRKKA